MLQSETERLVPQQRGGVVDNSAKLTPEQIKAARDANRRILGEGRKKQRGTYSAGLDASGIHVRNKLKKLLRQIKTAPNDSTARTRYIELGGRESDLPPLSA